jgi:hypothetical protein
MFARFVAQIRCAASLGTSSVAVRPDGKLSVVLCSHSGALGGTRFWKKKSPVIPSRQRLRTVGRSCTWLSSASAHSR